MSVFIDEKVFCDFMNDKYPLYHFKQGYSLISINVIHMKPIMSVVYFDGKVFAGARYNQQMGFFTDSVFFTQEQIQDFSLIRKGLGFEMCIQIVENEQLLPLKFKLTNYSGAKWHKFNLKNLQLMMG